jgi:phosphoglycolate phosphatase-like HAD superfamily hydrolase
VARPALLFDLDGTVWDSHPWFAVIIGKDNEAARDVALNALRGRKPAATLLRRAGISKSQFARLSRGDVLVETYPTVIHTLEALGRARRPLGAVTNLPGWIANEMVDGLRMRRFFGSVVTYERTTLRKPHPDPLLSFRRSTRCSRCEVPL